MPEISRAGASSQTLLRSRKLERRARTWRKTCSWIRAVLPTWRGPTSSSGRGAGGEQVVAGQVEPDLGDAGGEGQAAAAAAEDDEQVAAADGVAAQQQGQVEALAAQTRGEGAGGQFLVTVLPSQVVEQPGQ